MAPALLLSRKDTNQVVVYNTDKATGQSQPVPLSVTIRELHQTIAALEEETGLQTRADSCKNDYEKIIVQAYNYGRYQLEALAVRRGVHLKPLPAQQQQSTDGSSGSTAQSNKAKAELQAVLDRQMAHVDRLEKMPSPYLWQVLEDMEKRLRDLKYHAMTVEQQIENSTRSNEPTNVVAIIKSQNRALNKINNILGTLHARVEVLREQYRFYEKEENVLDKANWEEQERERQLNDRIRMEYVKAASTAKNSSSDQNVPPGAAAPGSFGAPAPSGFGGFGAPSPAPTTAGGGFNFSSTPAPAGGAFGGSTTPGPAPIGGGGGFNFSSAPAPAGGGAFGSTAPAPAFGGSTFSASSTPKKNSKSRSKGRLGR